MKNFNFFSQLFALVVFCFASNFATAQVSAMPGFNITGNEYSAAATAGFGGNAVVIFTKPVAGNTTVRLASYTVAAAGTVTLKDYEDFSNCGSPKITMLSPTRAILAMRNQNNNHEVRVYDLDASGGNITKKSWWASTGGGAVNPQSQNVEYLTGSSFVSAVVDGGTFRILSFTVNSSGSITFKDDDTHNIAGNAVYLKKMSSSRVIVGIKNANDLLKLICYDVNESTGVLSKKSEVQVNNVQQITMTAFGGNKLGCFAIDVNNNFDISTYEIATGGNFIVKNLYDNIKIPGTNTNYQLKSIDAQYDSGVSKIHLCSVRTSDKLNIIPFSFSSAGTLTIEPNTSKHYLSTATYTHTSASAASGLVINSSRQADSKYRIQGFKWGN